MSMIREDLMKEFAFWSTILVMKTLAMSVWTAKERFGKNVFANPEDKFDKSAKIMTGDPDVERVRRAHRNDLENVLPWFIMTGIWLTTQPSYYLATTLIRTFAVSRIAHTVSYVILQKQPWRALTFFVGYGVTFYEAVSTLFYYM